MLRVILLNECANQSSLHCQKWRGTLECKIKTELSEEQFGFVSGKGTRNSLFYLRTIAGRSIEVHVCFVDYKKAFDKGKHKEMLKLLRDINRDGKD